MTQITWEERFNTGIEVIDFQHKKIVSILNDLHVASIKSEAEAASEILKRMREYVTEHFSFEEELLRAANYQFTEAHIKLHQRYIERLDHLSQRHNAGESVAEEMSQFLTQWLVHHIGHEDQDYVDDVKVIMKDICQ